MELIWAVLELSWALVRQYVRGLFSGPGPVCSVARVLRGPCAPWPCGHVLRGPCSGEEKIDARRRRRKTTQGQNFPAGFGAAVDVLGGAAGNPRRFFLARGTALLNKIR